MKTSPRDQRAFLAFMLLALAGLWASSVRGEPVRRVLVPADKPEVWPTNGQRYLPIEQTSLARLLKTGENGAVRPVEMQVEARYSRHGTLVGEGRLRVEAPRPGFMPWPASPIAITNTRWQAGGRAAFGWWPAADDNVGQFGLVAPRSDDLQFDLRTPPVGWVGTRGRLTLNLPNALRRTILLDTPSWLRVGGESLIIQSASAPTDPEGRRLWRIEAPPGTPLALRFIDSRPQETETTERFGVVETTDIRLQPEGAAVTTRFELTSTRPLPDRLRVDLPVGMVLEQAFFADVRIAIRSLPTTERGIRDNANVVELELPAGHGAESCTLKLNGWAGVPIGTDWVAPRPRLLDADWSSGRLGIALTQGMELVDITLEQDVVAIPAAAATTNAIDETAGVSNQQHVEYQLTSPDASLMLRVRPTHSELQVAVQREFLFGDTSLKADTTLTPQTLTGEAPTALWFEVLHGWRISSVESSPASLLDRWGIETRDGHRLLRLSLSSTANAATLLGSKFVVHAQRDGMPVLNERQSLQELRSVIVRGVQTLSDQITLRATESQTLTPWNLETSRLIVIDPLATESEHAAGASEPLSPTAIDQLSIHGVESLRIDLAGLDHRALTEAGVQLRKRLTAFSAHTTLDVSLPANGATGVDYRLTAMFNNRRPANSSVVVRFDTPLPASVAWAGADGRQPLLVEPADEATARGAGARWRVRPASGEAWDGFTISTTLSGDNRWRLPLATIVRAASQRNELVISPALAAAGWVEETGLRPLSPPVDAPPGTLAFAYTERAADKGIELWRSIPGRPRPAAVLSSLTSRFAPDGIARHAAVYTSLRPGAELTVHLPKAAQFVGIENIRGEPLASQQPGDGSLVLPARRLENAGAVTIHYTTQTGRPNHGRTIRPTPPLTPAPPAAWSWRIELPPGRVLAGFDSSGTRRTTSWTGRLFGLFVTPGWSEITSSSPTTTTAWSVYELTTGTTAAARLSIVATRFSLRLRIGVLLVAIFAGAVIGNRRRLVLFAIGLAMSAAFILPASLAPLAASIWLGLLLSFPLGAVIDRIRGWQLVDKVAQLENQTTATQRTLLLLATCSLTGPAYAQPAPKLVVPEAVLTPVDDRFQPVGDKVYVREGLLTRLLAAEARQGRAEPGEAIVRSAEYRGRLVRSSGGTLVPRDWTMQLELTTFSRASKVWLPLRHDQAMWPTVAIVDGEPRPLRWNPAGDACWFDIDQPGDARAILTFRPTVVVADGESCLQLRLSPLSDARLTVEFPPDLSDLRTPFTQSTIRRRVDDGRLTASLASQPELLLCWTDESSEPTAEPTPISLLQWLRITPQGADLHVQAQADEAGDSLERVRIETPHGARPVESAFPETGQLGEDGFATKQAVFRLNRSTPLGVIRPPLVSVANAEIRSRALGVSVDAAFEWSLTTGSQTRSLDASEYSDRWAPLEAEPPTVDRAMLLKGDSRPSITVRPARRAVLLSQQLELRVDNELTTCAYQADFDANRPFGMRYAVQVPRPLVISDIACLSDGSEVSSSWSRPLPNRAVVFINNPPPGPLRVRMAAEMPHNHGEVVVPIVRFLGEAASLDVALRRNEGVLIEPLGLAWEAPPSTGTSDRTSLPVATLTSRPGAPAPAFLVQPNPARFEVDSLTLFEPTDAGARLTLLASVNITHGEVQRLPIAVAAGIEPPTVVEPMDAVLERADRIGAAGWRLVLSEPRQPGESLLVRLVTEVASADAERLPLAPLQIVGRVAHRPLVAVNPTDDELGGHWDLSALQPVDTPTWLRDAELDARQWRFCQSPESGRGRAITWVTNDTPLPSSIQVTLRDTRAAIATAGQATIATRFTIEPRGARVCRIRLPAGHTLLTAHVDGAPALCRLVEQADAAPNTWMLALRNTRQVANIALLTSGPIEATVSPTEIVNRAGESQVPAKSLYEIGAPVDATLSFGDDLTPLDPERLADARRRTTIPDISASATEINRFNIASLLANCGHRVAFSAEGAHVPPVVTTGQTLPIVGRWAVAMLILAVTLAGATRLAA